MDARLGVEKVQAGCRLMRNFFPQVHGPAYRRPGMVDQGACESDDADAKSRLFSFNFSTTTRFILEMFAGGMNIWSNGYLVPLDAPIVLPYTQDELFQVQLRQVNDICYLTHPKHIPLKLIRTTDTNWTVSDVFNLLAGVPTGEIIPGAAGLALMEIWQPWNYTNPSTLAQMQALRTAVGFDSPPSGTSDEPDLDLSATPAGGNPHFMRRVKAKFTVPTTGSWTLYFQADAGICAFIDGVYAGGIVGNNPAAESSQVHALTAGTIYQLEVYHWNLVGNFAGKVSISGPAVTKQAVPSSMLSKPDGAPSATAVKATINQWPPMLDENVGEITLTAGATTGTGVSLTASAALFLADHVGSFWQIAHRRDISYTEVVGVVGSFSTTSTAVRVLGNWDLYSYGDWSGTVHLERKNPAGTWDILRTWKGNHDRNIIANGSEDQESILRIRTDTMVGVAASGAAVPRFVLEAADAKIYGLARVTSVTSATVAVVSIVKDIYSTDATVLWTEGAFSDVRGYPRACGLHQQRLLFAGTKANPLRIWGSVTGDIENFRRSSLDDGSIDFTISAEESNAIQWLVSYLVLIIGTSGEVWSADGATEGGVITPTSVKFTQGGKFGSDDLPAQLVNDVPAFVERTGRKVRKLTYSTEERKYIGANLTVLAEHITAGGIVQTAFSGQPTAILWCVTGDGRLIGMTFEAEQNVYGWHQHNTPDGLIESVAVVYGSSADEVWLTVLRTFEGVTQRRMERLDVTGMAADFSTPALLCYTDSSKIITLDTPSTVVTGLEHLAGQLVSVLADGYESPQARVSALGTIGLPVAASTVIVGLPFTSLLQPMRQEFQMQNGTAQGRGVKVASMVLRLYESMGGQVADSPDGLFDTIPFRTPDDAMDVAIPLYTGDKNLPLSAHTRGSVDVTVKTSAPFPLNVLAMTLRLDVYDS